MPKFGDFNKASKDILGDDVYNYDTNLSVKTKAAGVAFKAKGDAKSQKLTASKIAVFDGCTIKKFELGTSGKIVAEVTLDNVMDGLKFGVDVEGSAGGAGMPKIKIDYSGDGFISNTKINAGSMNITESLAFKQDAYWLGASANFDANASELTSLDVGLFSGEGGSNFSVNASDILGDSCAISTAYARDLNSDTKVAADLAWNPTASDFNIGFTHQYDKLTTFSAKANINGKGNAGIGGVPLCIALSSKLTDNVGFDAGWSTSFNGGAAQKVGFRFTVDV